MKSVDFDQLVEDQFEDCRYTLAGKGADYSSPDDRLSNFKGAAERLGLTPLQVLGVYRDKHDCAINAFIAKNKLESEPISGRITDAINYLLLLRALIEDSHA